MPRKPATQKDPVLDEVRKIKDRLASQYGYDAEAMLRDAMRRQRRRAQRAVTLAKRPVFDA